MSSFRSVRSAGVGMLIVLIAVITLYSHFSVSRMENGIGVIVSDYQDRIFELDNILSEFMTVSSLLSPSAVSDGSNTDMALEKTSLLIERSTSFRDSLRQGSASAMMDEFIGKLEEFKSGIVSYAMEGLDQTRLSLLKTHRDAGAIGRRLRNEMFAELKDRGVSIIMQGASGKKLGIVIGLIGILTGVAVFILLQNSLSGTVREMVAFSSAIADGDLSRKPGTSSDHDTAALFSSAAAMSEKLSRLIGEIRESSSEIHANSLALGKSFHSFTDGAKIESSSIESVSSAVKEMEQITKEINSKTQDLNRSLQDSSSSLHEMTASIKEISGFADKAFHEVDKISSSHLQINSIMSNTLDSLNSLTYASRQTSSRTRELTSSITEVGHRANESEKLTREVSIMAKENGISALQKMIDVSRKNKVLVDNYSRVIESLGNKSSSIGQILDVIYDVADQSSLLSLNASIIAAQAGEHGKSFGVVANEVRKLSNTTTVNLKQIEAVVQGVRKEVAEAVNMVQGIVEGMESSITAAVQANEVLVIIEDVSSRSTEMAEEIAQSVENQVAYCNDIHQNVKNYSDQITRIQEVMNEQKKGSDLILDSVEEIRSIAEQLRNSTFEQSKGSSIISQTINETSAFSERLVHTIQGQQEANLHTIEALEQISTNVISNINTMDDLQKIIRKIQSLDEKLVSQINRFKLSG